MVIVHLFRLSQTLTETEITTDGAQKAHGYGSLSLEIRGNISFNVATVASFKNGDGLCFINDDRELEEP